MGSRKTINWDDLDRYKLQHMSMAEYNARKITHMHFSHKDPDMPVIKARTLYKNGILLDKSTNMQAVATTLTFLAERMAQLCVDLCKAVDSK